MRVFAAVLLACAVATTAQAKGRPFTVEDLLSLEDTGHAAFSADGRWLVYETFAPWKTAQRFDRDFLVAQGLGRLFVVDLASDAAPRPLLPPEPGAGDTLGDLSPSGDKVMVFRLKDRRRELGVVTLATGAVVWTGLHVEPEVWWTSALWRNDREIVVTTRPPEAASTLLARGWLVQARTQDAWAAAARGERAGVALGAGRFADMNPPAPATDLVLVNAVTGTTRVVASGPFGALSLAPGGRTAAVQADAETILPDAQTVLGPGAERRRRLVMIDLDSGRVATPCPTCDLLPLVWAWSPDGRDLAAPARRDGEDWKAARYWRFSARGQATLLSSTVSVGVGGRFLPESGVAWPGRDPIVLGRTASAPRLDWWRLTAKGPVNLTAGASGVLSQIPATASGSVLLRTLSGLVSVRGDTPPRSAPGRPIETAPPLGGRTGQAVVVEAPTGAALVDADGATRPLPDLPPSTRVLALAPRAGAVLGETRDAHGVRTLVLSRPGLADRPLTTINAALAAVDFSAPIPIHHKGAAGQALTSWLYLPPDGADRPDLPVIVVPYPGTTYVQPMAEEGPGELKFDANIPLMTANGYAVIVPSLPLALDKEPMAGLADAMLAIVDQARINHPNLSGKRLAVWGQSYGGYGALAAGVESPRFQAIIATAPVTNLIARHAPLPGVAMAMPETFLQIASRLRWAETGQGRMGVPPWTDPDRYVRNSPALQVDKITAPVMLVVGDLDSDPGQVRAMFASLYRLGKDAQLLEYRGEQHVMISPGNVRDLYARAFAFLRDALGDEPGGTAKPEAIRPSQ